MKDSLKEKNMIKKIASVLSAVLLMICLAIPVYAADIPGEYQSAADSGFHYSHSPLDNPEVASDVIINRETVYGYSPNPDSARIGVLALNDWTDPVWVNTKKQERTELYRAGSTSLDPALDACLGLYDYYFTAYVAAGEAKAYSPADEAFVSGWNENKPDDVLWAKHEEVYKNPQYFDPSTGDIKWPANNGFWGDSFDYTLQPYTQIDRYGSDYGTFASMYGSSIEGYSLSPGSEYKNYSIFTVRKPVKCQAGAVYPWFDEPGGATQVMFDIPIKDLLADGSLERTYYR